MTRRDSTRHLIPVVILAGAATCLLPGCGGGGEAEGTGVAARPDPAGDPVMPPPTPAPEAEPATATTGGPGADEIDAALDAAQQYLDGDDLPRAEAVLAVLVEKAPRESRAHELLGQVLARRAVKARQAGQPDAAAASYAEAYESYSRAVELDPASAGLQQSAGVVAHAAGLPEEALAHYRAAMKLDPRHPQYPLYAAQVLIETERYDEAARALDTVLVLDPDEPVAHASLAIVALEQGRHDEALMHIGEARRISPDDLRFRAQEARIHRRSGDPEQGAQLLQALPLESRTTELVTSELAACYEDAERYALAGIAWEQRFQAIRGERDAYLAAVRAGRAYLQEGAIERARGLLSEAKILAWSSPEVQEFEAEFMSRSAADPGK
ncbi:MAG: tetratricopeptide repeat protein [Planctomycetota bacterium]